MIGYQSRCDEKRAKPAFRKSTFFGKTRVICEKSTELVEGDFPEDTPIFSWVSQQISKFRRA